MRTNYRFSLEESLNEKMIKEVTQMKESNVNVAEVENTDNSGQIYTDTICEENSLNYHCNMDQNVNFSEFKDVHGIIPWPHRTVSQKRKVC